MGKNLDIIEVNQWVSRMNAKIFILKVFFADLEKTTSEVPIYIYIR